MGEQYVVRIFKQYVVRKKILWNSIVRKLPELCLYTQGGIYGLKSITTVSRG